MGVLSIPYRLLCFLINLSLFTPFSKGVELSPGFPHIWLVSVLYLGFCPFILNGDSVVVGMILTLTLRTDTLTVSPTVNLKSVKERLFHLNPVKRLKPSKNLHPSVDKHCSSLTRRKSSSLKFNPKLSLPQCKQCSKNIYIWFLGMWLKNVPKFLCGVCDR